MDELRLLWYLALSNLCNNVEIDKLNGQLAMNLYLCTELWFPSIDKLIL